MPKIRTLTPGASPAHHFGAEVRRAREETKTTQSALGELVPCDTSTVSRVEAGLIAPDEAFARACDAAFPRWHGWFLRFWQDSQTWGASVFPQSLREYVDYEAAAVTLWTCQHSFVPGVLQVEGYARAVLAQHIGTTPEEVAERTEARVARGSILNRENPPQLWVLLDESILHRQMAPADVMAEQMRHLAAMAARPNITAQVIPWGPDPHAGLNGAFVVAQTPDTTVAYVNHQVYSTTTDSPVTVATFISTFDHLRTEAYRGRDSLELFTKAAERWEH